MLELATGSSMSLEDVHHAQPHAFYQKNTHLHPPPMEWLRMVEAEEQLETMRKLAADPAPQHPRQQ